MAEVAARPWLALGVLHLVAAALMALPLASGARFFPGASHALVAAAGVFLVAGGIAYGFAPPFLKRELIGAWPATLALSAILAGTAIALAAGPVSQDWSRLVAGAHAIAYVALPAHLVGSAIAGKPWRGGIALFAKDQPFRIGDTIAASCFAAALAALAGAGILLATSPRNLVYPGLVALLLGFALPFFAGVLVFLLPRNAKRPLPGATLVAAALLLQALSAAALTLAFALPGRADFRYPSAGILVAAFLFGVAMLRLRYPEPLGAQIRRARPWLRASAALAVLAGIAIPLSVAGGGPGSLFPAAGYATLLLAASLAIATLLLAAPILVNAVPREGRWSAMASALLIAGLFLIAPSFQYPRSAFPGALLVAAGALVALWGLWPMRQPRRDC